MAPSELIALKFPLKDDFFFFFFLWDSFAVLPPLRDVNDPPALSGI